MTAGKKLFVSDVDDDCFCVCFAFFSVVQPMLQTGGTAAKNKFDRSRGGNFRLRPARLLKINAGRQEFLMKDFGKKRLRGRYLKYSSKYRKGKSQANITQFISGRPFFRPANRFSVFPTQIFQQSGKRKPGTRTGKDSGATQPHALVIGVDCPFFDNVICLLPPVKIYHF